MGLRNPWVSAAGCSVVWVQVEPKPNLYPWGRFDRFHQNFGRTLNSADGCSSCYPHAHYLKHSAVPSTTTASPPCSTVSYAVFSPSSILTSQLYSTSLCTSNLFLTQLHTSLISFIVVQVVFILSLIFLLFSIFSHHLCPIHHFNHLLFYSLIILVPCVPSHHSSSLHVNILC